MKVYIRKGWGKKSIGIKLKLIGAFIIPVVLIIVLGVSSYKQARSSIISNYEMTSQTSLMMMNKYFGVGFESALAKATQLNVNETAKMYFSGYYKKNALEESNKRAELTEYIKNMVMVTDMVQNVGILSKNVKGLWNDSVVPIDVYEKFIESEEGILVEGKEEKNIWLGMHPSIDGELNNSSADYCISLVKKFIDINYKNAGYIIIDIKDEFIKNTMQEANLGEGSILGFITQDGREILNQDIEEFSFCNQEFYKKIQASEEASGFEYVEYNGQQYLFLYEKLIDEGAMTCALVEESILLNKVATVKVTTLAITTLASIIAIAIGWMLAASIEKKIHSANQTLEEVARGNLTQKLVYKSKDEFSILAKGIFNMIDSMKKMIQSMSIVSTTVLKSATHISKGSEDLLEASHQIANTVSSIKEGVGQQAEDSQNCLMQMSNLSLQVNEVCDCSERVQEVANITRSSVKSGLESIEELKEKASCTADITSTVRKDIKTLEQKSNEIGSIVGTIEEIAGKTNLLALNASIESARAGEAGKGFAVVAEEIRALAEQSKQATAKIADIIKQIQTETNKTVLVTEEAEQIVASQETALIDTVDAFNSIDLQVDKLLNGLKEISQAVNNIDQSKDQTLQMIQDISAMLQETVAATVELDNTAVKQISTVQGLSQTVADLENEAKKLDGEVSVFCIE